MPWAQIDDNMLDCPKAIEAGPEATDLLLRAIVWCSRHMTDGRIPKAALGTVSGGSRRALVRMMRLVKCGWVADSGDHFLIVDYLDWNRSKAQVLEARAKDNARKPKGFRSDNSKHSERNPSGVRTESATPSERNPDRFQPSSPLPSSPNLVEDPPIVPHDAGAPAPAPPLALEAEPTPERKKRTVKERVLSKTALEVQAFIASEEGSGVAYPPSSFDGLESLLRKNEITGDDAMLLVKYATTDNWCRATIRMNPTILFRKERWPGMLAQAKAKPASRTPPRNPAMHDPFLDTEEGRQWKADVAAAEARNMAKYEQEASDGE